MPYESIKDTNLIAHNADISSMNINVDPNFEEGMFSLAQETI